MKDNSEQVKDNVPTTEPATSIAPVNAPAQSEPVNTPENSEPEQPLRPVRELPLETQPSTDNTGNIRPTVEAAMPNTQGTAANPEAPDAAVIKEQKEHQAEVNKAASAEADQKLNKILEETTSEP